MATEGFRNRLKNCVTMKPDRHQRQVQRREINLKRYIGPWAMMDCHGTRLYISYLLWKALVGIMWEGLSYSRARFTSAGYLSPLGIWRSSQESIHVNRRHDISWIWILS